MVSGQARKLWLMTGSRILRTLNDFLFTSRHRVAKAGLNEILSILSIFEEEYAMLTLS